MNVSDDMLTRYADGELGADDRAAVEAAAGRDPDIARRLAEHQLLRRQLAEAYGPVLDEGVPDRLASLFAGPGDPAAPVIDLADVRARRLAPRWPAWAQAGGMAACLVGGLVVGGLFMQGAPAPLTAGSDGRMLAHGELAAALDQRLASDPPAGHVAVAVSFASRDGRYCRTFEVTSSKAGGQSLAGLACRDPTGWSVPIAVAQSPADQTGPYRQAASATPPAVLQAVDRMMAGDALDAGQESAARAAGWRK